MSDDNNEKQTSSTSVMRAISRNLDMLKIVQRLFCRIQRVPYCHLRVIVSRRGPHRKPCRSSVVPYTSLAIDQFHTHFIVTYIVVIISRQYEPRIRTRTFRSCHVRLQRWTSNRLTRATRHFPHGQMVFKGYTTSDLDVLEPFA